MADVSVCRSFSMDMIYIAGSLEIGAGCLTTNVVGEDMHPPVFGRSSFPVKIILAKADKHPGNLKTQHTV